MYMDEKNLLTYSPNVGATCQAWESTTHPDCLKDGDKPSWCSEKWCFVDPCKDCILVICYLWKHRQLVLPAQRQVLRSPGDRGSMRKAQQVCLEWQGMLGKGSG